MRKLSSMRVLACWLAMAAGMQGQQYAFRNFGQNEGLKNLSVNAMAMDRAGFLWVATENGVYRFLGSSFQRFGPDQGIAELEATDIVADANGTVWVGTDENLYRWDGRRFLAAGRDPIPIARLRNLFVEDARNLLVVDRKQLYRLEHDSQGRMLSFLPVIPSSLAATQPELADLSSVNVVSEPGHGLRIWAGCGKRLCSWLDRGATGHAQPERGEVTAWGKDKGVAEDLWESLLRDRWGNLWAAGREHVMELASGATQFQDRSIPGSDPENIYGSAPLTEDPEGRVMAPTEDGVARWEGTGWRHIGHANGLARISHSACILFDAAGDAWIGGHGNGVFHWFGYRDWEGWDDTQGLPSSIVWTLQPLAGGRVLAGTDEGPAWIEAHSGLAGPLSSTRPWRFGQVDGMDLDRNGAVWVAGMVGSILRIDPKTGRTEQTATLPPEIDYALADRKGQLFLTHKPSGVYVRETPQAVPHRIAEVDALLGTSTRIPAVCESPDGSVWFLGGNRLMRERNGQWTLPEVQGQQQHLHGELLSNYCAADGTVWVTGEHAGTWRMTPMGDRLQAWQLATPDEFHSLSPVAILVDSRGWVWLGTDEGLLIWNGQAWRQMTVESGLIWNDVDQGVLKEAPDGSIWVGTSAGVSHLLHPERAFDPVFLDIAVTGVERGGNLYSAAQEITLPWSRQQLQVQVSSSTMRNRSELIFKYRMEGLQPDWIESRDGRAVFSALPPGSYTFMAVAGNAGLNAYSSTVTVHVTILPPWWRSQWFFALCGLAFVFLLIAADKLRARALKARSRALEDMVRERTQELEASREQLRIQATEDGLTGMLNHVAVLKVLNAQIERAGREEKPLVLAMADLDHFKQVNDAFGHMAGDEALRLFAAAVGTAIRSYDYAGRYGGEEFLLILTEIPRGAIAARMKKLHDAISNIEVQLPEATFTLNCSIGATVFDPSGPHKSAEALLSVADRALYAAKEAGRNRVVFQDANSPDSDAKETAPETHLPE